MKKSKGVLTLEAALVMPVVIYTMFLMIFLSLLIYTRIYVAISVNKATAIATAYWYDSNSPIYNKENNGSSIIANAIGTIGSSHIKEDNIKALVEEKIDAAPMNIVKSKVSVDSKNYLIYNNLIVDVECTYKPPLAGLFKLFGLSKDGTISDTFRKEVKLSSTEENMRAITYIGKLINKATEDGKIQDAIEGAGNSIDSATEKVKEIKEIFYKVTGETDKTEETEEGD